MGSDGWKVTVSALLGQRELARRENAASSARPDRADHIHLSGV
jgi:hypothetical protein